MGYIRVGPPAPLPPRARLAAPPPAPVQAPPCQSRAGPHPCAAPLWALRWGRGEGKRVAGPSRGARSCPGLARRGPSLRAGARPLGPQRGPSPSARVPAHARMGALVAGARREQGRKGEEGGAQRGGREGGREERGEGREGAIDRGRIGGREGGKVGGRIGGRRDQWREER